MRSIFARLLTSHAVVVILATLMLGLTLSYVVHQQSIEVKRKDLLQRGASVAAYIAPQVQSGQMPGPATLHSLGEITGAVIWLVDGDRKVVAGNPPPYWRSTPAGLERLGEVFTGSAQSWVSASRRLADRSIVVAVPVQKLGRPIAVFLYFPYAAIETSSLNLFQLFLLPFLASILVAIALGWLMSRSLIAPIRDIGISAARFSAGDHSSRAKATGEDEIGMLGRTFNYMAESIERTEANRRDFLANVSHELKTPVACVQAMTEALLDDVVVDPNERKKYLQRIISESHRMDSLIKDLLDLSRIEAGELKINFQSLPIELFLKSQIDKMSEMLAEKQLTATLEISEASLRVIADSDRLAQVFDNLLSNAIRYSPTGGAISLKVWTSGYRVLIDVADQGDGIPAEELPKIFERFYRVEKSRTRSAGGTGLGLAICKRLMEAMRGTITAESPAGSGAIFTISLPQAN